MAINHNELSEKGMGKYGRSRFPKPTNAHKAQGIDNFTQKKAPCTSQPLVYKQGRRGWGISLPHLADGGCLKTGVFLLRKAA